MSTIAPKTFKDLSLSPADAFRNIAAMIEAGLLIAVTDKPDDSDLGDCIFHQARQYAEAANSHALECFKYHQENNNHCPSASVSESQLNSWAADIGNCKDALSNAMDCIPQELHAMGTLTIVFEKLNDLQETLCKQADKINS